MRFKDEIIRFKPTDGLKKYFYNTSWLLFENLLRLLGGVLIGIWVARYLGPKQFGTLNYVLAFTTIFGVTAKLGLDSIVVRNLVNEPEKQLVYMGTAFWLKIFGGVLSFAVISIAILFSSNDKTTNFYILLLSIGIIFQSFEVIDFYFQSKVKSKFVSLSKIIQLCISSIFKIYFILSSADLFWFVVVLLFDQITLAISLFISYSLQKEGCFCILIDFATAKKLIKDSWPLIFSSFVIMIYMRIDQLLIKSMLGDREVGIYSASLRLTEVWYFIPIIITNSIFPAIINAKKKGKLIYCKQLKRLYTFLVWTAIIIALLVTFNSNWIIKLLYGHYYLGAGRVLTIHIWTGVFVFLGVASGKWYLTENLQKYSSFNMFVGAVVNVILNLILIPKYGIYGSAIATVISQGIAVYFMNICFRKTRDNFVRLTYSIFLPLKGLR